MRKMINKSVYFIILITALLFLTGCAYTTPTAPTAEQVTAAFGFTSVFNTVEVQTVAHVDDADEPIDTENADQYDDIEQPPEETAQGWVVNPYIVALREQYENDEIVGYIYIEGTDIRYVVTQHTDNVFYLYHDIHRRPDRAGWVFLDYENDLTREDPNTIIYGHNMRQNIRFHGIRHFQNRDFFDTHRYITFNTAYGEYRWEIFSFYRTHIDFFYIQVHFNSDEEFYELLAEMAARSMHPSDVIVGPGDRVLTLSTCTNNDRDERFVVNARLIQ